MRTCTRWTTSTAWRVGKVAVKIYQHPRGSAPDVPLALIRAVRHFVEAHGPAVELARAPMVVARIEQEAERHLEHFGDLARIGDQLERRRQQAHDRRHPVAGARVIV